MPSATDLSEQILAKLASTQPATASQVATTHGIGRSTASKLLAALQAEGHVHRHPGGRGPNGRRQPDHWTLPNHPSAKATPAPAGPATPEAPAAGTPDRTPPDGQAGTPNKPAPTADAPSTPDNGATSETGRLRPGELRSLVDAYLAARPGQQLTPTAIGKALDRSAGAVSNALATLASHGRAIQVSTRPRRYTTSSK